MADFWPSSLPQFFEIDSYEEGLGDGRLRTNMDRGPAKVRRMTTAQVRPLRGTVVVDSAQLATFRQFVAVNLLGGSLPFFLPEQCTPFHQPILVRFGEQMPTWAYMGIDMWRLSLDLEVLPG